MYYEDYLCFLGGEVVKSNKELNTLIFVLILVVGILFVASKSTYLKYKIGGLAQYKRFKVITKNMQKKKLDNITYYYANKSDETYINTLKEYLKEGEGKINPLLGQTTLYPFNIIMFTTSEAFGKAFNINPHESKALTDLDSLYLPCANITSSVLVHEYTHYKMNSLFKENGLSIFKIPSWYKEGVSEYACSTFFPDRFKNPKLQAIQDFKKLDTTKQMGESEFNGQESYMQSYIAVKKIIQLKGQNAIQEILINTKSMTFYTSFEKVLGLSIDDFQKLLENELKSTDILNALLKSASMYSQQKKFDKAKDAYLEATVKYPYSELAWLNLGHSYIDIGDFNSAIRAREKLISISEKKTLSYFYYSQLLIAIDLNKAVSMAEKSAQLAKSEKSDSAKFIMNYFLLLKSLRDNINSDKPFTQYIALIKGDYIYANMLKIHIINQVLAKYPDKNYYQKQQLIKLKSDLEKQ